MIFLFNEIVIGYESFYKKPKPSNGPCIDSLERMLATTKGSMFHCLGCDKVQRVCPSEISCQAMIDDIYRNCDEVTLPRRHFYFDPPVSKIIIDKENFKMKLNLNHRINSFQMENKYI